ncbi:Imidazole glycerol phosphate synthase subunit HisH [Thalassocella blandensis]|nr:Imidazole glycerol phosphate synthase subunit HisH [Thalassocella blandensis]
MRIHYLQHVPFENLSLIADWATTQGHLLSSTKFYLDKYKLPELEDFDMLIALGGPMSVNNDSEHPWLVQERALLKEAIKANKYVLGICLGAQQIAKALDCQVKLKSSKEIGWYPISLTDQALRLPLFTGINTSLSVFHWHGEEFEVPSEGVLLASSAACKNQAFLYRDHVLALQFHLEMDIAAIEKIVEACSDELVDDKYIQSKSTILDKAKLYHLNLTLFRLLDNWLSS